MFSVARRESLLCDHPGERDCPAGHKSCSGSPLMVSPIQALVAAHKAAARLSFLNDAIETGSYRMSGAVEIRRNEASPGQTSHERSPVGGRAECRRELNGVDRKSTRLNSSHL